ncbi:MAG: serine hydrolase domain-containing protein [Steroidobacteraceae bacterium]
MRTILFLTTMVGAAQLAIAAQPAPLPDDQVVTRTQQVVEQIMRRPEAVGLSVAVARGDRIIVEQGIGKADLEFDAPANAQTMFRIGSLTKQFTAASIMKLVERGRIKLDDDLHKYVPTFDTGGRMVTIRQLLNHSSGVPNVTSQAGFVTDMAPRDLTNEQVLATVKGVKFDFEPGKGWNYSNTGYYLLGMIIQAVDGRPYDRFMQEELFDPLGLTRTRHGSEREIIKNRAQGYSGGTAVSARRNDAALSMIVPGAAGSLSSTAGDLVRWQIALVNGRAVSTDSWQQMIGSTVATTRGAVRYGFGLQVEEAEGMRRISHSGSIQGFNSVIHYLPEAGWYVAVISSSETLPSTVVAEQILAALSGAAPAPVSRTAPKEGSEAALRRFVAAVAKGEPDYSRMGVRLADTIRAQQSAAQAQLQPLGAIDTVTFVNVGMAGNDVFNVNFTSGATMVISIGLDDEGKVVSAGLRPAEVPTAR